MRRLNRTPLLSLALTCACLTPLAAAGPDWLAVVGLYPAPGSVTGQSEQAILLWLQGSRTPQDVARASSESTPSLGCFIQDITAPAGVAGRSGPIDLSRFPLTEAVLNQARQDFLPIQESLLNTFLRPRPYAANAAVMPVLPLEASYSYPSLNAALGALFAEILRQWDPSDQPAFDATGALLGTDQVLGGVHYPSDVQAGQRLGKAFADAWIDQHLALIQTACPEWSGR